MFEINPKDIEQFEHIQKQLDIRGKDPLIDISNPRYLFDPIIIPGVDTLHHNSYLLTIGSLSPVAGGRIPRIDLTNQEHQKILGMSLFVQKQDIKALESLLSDDKKHLLEMHANWMAKRNEYVTYKGEMTRLSSGICGWIIGTTTSQLVGVPGGGAAGKKIFEKIFDQSNSTGLMVMPLDEFRCLTSSFHNTEELDAAVRMLQKCGVSSPSLEHEADVQRKFLNLREESSSSNYGPALISLERMQHELRVSSTEIEEQIRKMNKVTVDNAAMQLQQAELQGKIQNFRNTGTSISTFVEYGFKKPELAFLLRTGVEVVSKTAEIMCLRSAAPPVLAVALGNPVLAICALGASVFSSFRARKEAKAQAEVMQQFMRNMQTLANQIQQNVVSLGDQINRVHRDLVQHINAIGEQITFSFRMLTDYFGDQFWLLHIDDYRILHAVEKLIDNLRQIQTTINRDHYLIHLEELNSQRSSSNTHTEVERRGFSEEYDKLQQLLKEFSALEICSPLFKAKREQILASFLTLLHKPAVHTTGIQDSTVTVYTALGDQLESDATICIRNALERVNFLLRAIPRQDHYMKFNRIQLLRWTRLFITFLNALQPNEDLMREIKNSEVAIIIQQALRDETLVSGIFINFLPQIISKYNEQISKVIAEVKNICGVVNIQCKKECEDRLQAKQNLRTHELGFAIPIIPVKPDKSKSKHKHERDIDMQREVRHHAIQDAIFIISQHAVTLQLSGAELHDLQEFQQLFNDFCHHGEIHRQVCGHKESNKSGKNKDKKYPRAVRYLQLKKLIFDLIENKRAYLAEEKIKIVSMTEIVSKTEVFTRQKDQLSEAAMAIASPLHHALQCLNDCYCEFNALRAYCFTDNFTEILEQQQKHSIAHIMTSHDFFHHLLRMQPFNEASLIDLLHSGQHQNQIGELASQNLCCVQQESRSLLDALEMILNRKTAVSKAQIVAGENITTGSCFFSRQATQDLENHAQRRHERQAEGNHEEPIQQGRMRFGS